jgi:hypothetical protein
MSISFGAPRKGANNPDDLTSFVKAQAFVFFCFLEGESDERKVWIRRRAVGAGRICGERKSVVRRSSSARGLQ